ncbi:hypothetical protein [Dolichospermum flos-aquae]|uniref:Uncharacterized protein n=1 Tax=Dolichospermum flos-aquae CCAP 1403/13F TaxID=315271 RepID=A0A6H2BVL6_DOLFA|nr:hypothetical protein [Dolichospermum flos-aquae]QJB42814.1 hypothetical protein HGD76_00395 [Dolichospermum flos-aquae CCAP 1403/13F]
MSVVRCPLSVGAKHLEDKLSVIAKNSSPNASPVQLFVVRCPLFVVLPLTNHQSPITNHQSPKLCQLTQEFPAKPSDIH